MFRLMVLGVLLNLTSVTRNKSKTNVVYCILFFNKNFNLLGQLGVQLIEVVVIIGTLLLLQVYTVSTI